MAARWQLDGGLLLFNLPPMWIAAVVVILTVSTSNLAAADAIYEG